MSNPDAVSDPDAIRALLLEQAEDARRAIASLDGSIDAIVKARLDSNSDDEHDPEGSTLAFERSQSDALLRQTEQRLNDIAASLARLDAGTYGKCEVCGTRIADARLEARPTARTCIDCAT